MIRVVIADDSPAAQRLLTSLLDADPDVEVAGIASDGLQAINLVKQLRPDVVAVDLRMPGIDGVETARKIMETCPTPVVIVSAVPDDFELDVPRRAMEVGAVAVLRKPPGADAPLHRQNAKEFVDTVKLMSEIKVVRRRRLGRPAVGQSDATGGQGPRMLVAIGASTGGPQALRELLKRLPGDAPWSLLIVQHISTGFASGLIDWLNAFSPIPIQLATEGAIIRSGRGYLAPEDRHMEVGKGGRVYLSADPPEHGHRPAVARMFRSVAQYWAPHAIGVLLSGMGKDGAEELLRMRNAGAVTIAQDEVSSLIYGMPGEAVALGAAQHVLPPEEIAALIARLASQREAASGGRTGNRGEV